jgi:hypothetical protein
VALAKKLASLLLMSSPDVLSLNDQAELGPERAPGGSQFSLLLRHFVERFFNHESASPDGDAKARLVLAAFAVGLPEFAVALYLWPVYHPFQGLPPGSGRHLQPPSYWLQVNHHLFFVVYSFVAMGIATVFEWDLFFPDLLDVFVLTPLPIANLRMFFARVAAIGLLVAGFLFDANVLAPFVLPAATDPPNLPRFLAGHIVAVMGSGLFAAVLILAVEGLLLSVLGERLFRRLSLLIQGFSITALLLLLLLFPVMSDAVPVILRSGSTFSLCIPPLWFLGIYQRLMEGPAAMPVYTRLAETGGVALLATASLAALTYPIAYMRRVRQLVEGPGTRTTRNWALLPLHKLLHATVVRSPVRRAVFHFISETLLRVQRYRIYLVLYGSVGLSVVAATILRLAVVHGQIHVEVSSDGIRAAIGIVAFWTIAGLRVAFVSPGNQKGSWVFRLVHGRPPGFETAMEQFEAAKVWALLWGLVVTFGACAAFRVLAPPQISSWTSNLSMWLVATGMCVLLANILFLNVRIVAFTGESSGEQPNLAATLLKYIAFAPGAAVLPFFAEPWIEMSVSHFVAATMAIAAGHWALRVRQRAIIREHCNMPALEDGEEDFPMKLGLRY